MNKQYILEITWLDSGRVCYLIEQKEETKTRNAQMWTTDDPNGARIFKKRVPQWVLDNKYNIRERIENYLKFRLKLELKELKGI